MRIRLKTPQPRSLMQFWIAQVYAWKPHSHQCTFNMNLIRLKGLGARRWELIRGAMLLWEAFCEPVRSDWPMAHGNQRLQQCLERGLKGLSTSELLKNSSAKPPDAGFSTVLFSIWDQCAKVTSVSQSPQPCCVTGSARLPDLYPR